MENFNEATRLACEKGGYSWKIDVTMESMLLDPLWWQALGKAMGWYEHQEIEVKLPSNPDEARKMMIDAEENLGVILKMNDERLVYSPYKRGQLHWKEHWHRFIAHLAEGKDADSFFKETNQ